MEESIQIIKNRIVGILLNNKPSIYIYGSVVFEDFKLGWSDIDILCLTEIKISDEQAKQLVNLRQELLEEYKDNMYFRSFEGSFVSREAFINDITDTVVYWGTTGQKVTNKFNFDPFSMMELIGNGYLIYGNEVRNKLKYPTRKEIVKAVIDHYKVIRKYAVITGKDLYSAGWMLDIARCIYTLRTEKNISKTEAGKWALDNNLVPDVEVMEKVINLREQPSLYKNNKEVMEWLDKLGKYIQRFADVLEEEILKKSSIHTR